jgi:hypothetical protein
MILARRNGVGPFTSTMRLWYPFFSAALIFALCESMLCQAPADGGETLRACLLVTPGAANVKRSKSHGEDQLLYRVEAVYPAADVLRTITGRLKTMGWKPLEDFLNPGLQSSHVRGWQYYEDQSKQPKTTVRVWQGDWQNVLGDIVTYRLEYRCGDNLCSSTRDLRNLEVIAIYIAADLAKHMKQSASRDPASQ